MVVCSREDESDQRQDGSSVASGHSHEDDTANVRQTAVAAAARPASRLAAKCGAGPRRICQPPEITASATDSLNLI